jgi:hypothetical protein
MYARSRKYCRENREDADKYDCTTLPMLNKLLAGVVEGGSECSTRETSEQFQIRKGVMPPLIDSSVPQAHTTY